MKQTLSFTVFLLPLLLALTGCRKEAAPPNIIFLLTDDQRWDAMGCAGNKLIRTPNIDRLASEGILFENACVTTSICCASRASILAGQYARRTGIIDFVTDFSPAALAETYPLLLRKAGYRTGFVGKYGVGDTLPVQEFDYWRGVPGQPAYEHFDEQGNMKHYTRIVSEQCSEFLSGCDKNRPFCLSVSFKAPHVQDGDPRQFIYDPAYKDLFAKDSIPFPRTGGDEYFYSFPEFFTRNNEARRRWEIRFSTPSKYQESVRGYYRLIYGVDVVVGEIMAQLKEDGLDQNTVIIFTGDNGFYLGEHGLAGKWYGHEESIRVPLIIYDPRAAQQDRGLNLEHIALNIDIAPTILDMCGVSIPENMQGRSLMGPVRDPSAAWRDEFFYEHLFIMPDDANTVIPPSEGVAGLRYKYLRYLDTEPAFEEFYDLENDPHEKTNLAGDPGYAELLKTYRHRLNEFREKAR